MPPSRTGRSGSPPTSAAPTSQQNDRRAGGTGAASAAAGSEGQPGALGRVPRTGRAHALRRRVHRASDLLAAGRGRPRPGRGRLRAARDAGFAVAPPAADHAAPTSSPRRPPPSPTAATRSTGSTRRCCRSPAPPGPIAGRELTPRPVDPVELGRLRHRRAHRYRLVGHAAAAAGDEAAATARLHGQFAALPGDRGAGRRAIADARWSGRPRRSPLCPDAARPADGRRLRPGAGRRARGRADLARAAAAAVPRRASPRPTNRRGWRCASRARGWSSHGLALAHTHTRLNAAQIHNVVRQRLGIADPPEDRSHRRALLAAINAALDAVQPVPVDFGALIVEQASAARLMMTVAQIVKHIDGSVPVRFLIAETETGYTLLAALWLARLFGVERHIEISPLFETAEALEQGATVLEEALRSPHYRAYLQATGRLALQFGYSDSRPLCRPARRQLPDRAAAPEDRRHAGAARRHRRRGDPVRHPRREHRPRRASGLAGRPAEIPVADRVAAGAEPGGAEGARGERVPGRRRLSAVRHAGTGAGDDHAHRRADLSSRGRADRGSGLCRSGFRRRFLRHHPRRAWRGWWRMRATPRCSARSARRCSIAPARARRRGSRRAWPARRASAIRASCGRSPTTRSCSSSAGARTRCRGWARRRRGTRRRSPRCAPNSRRFHRALDLATHALAHSDIDVLRAVIAHARSRHLARPRGAHRRPGRREALVAVARALERLDIWAAAQSMFRRIQADHLALRVAWPDAPHMATREVLLHALRLALIHRIWLLATEISDFSPRHGVTRQVLEAAILRLDIEPSLALLAEIFPAAPDPARSATTPSPRRRAAPRPMRGSTRRFSPRCAALFALVREIATAITHEVGAFG